MSEAIRALFEQGHSIRACCQVSGLPRARYHCLLQGPKVEAGGPWASGARPADGSALVLLRLPARD